MISNPSFTYQQGDTYLQLGLLSRSGVFHFFGTRHLASAGGIPGEPKGVIRAHQVHGDRLLHVVDDRDMSGVSADGLITDRPDRMLSVSTADCVPVLIVDPVKRVIAAIHAGWRGTALNISGKAVHTMVQSYGCAPQNLVVGIGPSIGPCCYVVGEEVWSPIQKGYGAGALRKKPDGQVMLDLPALNFCQLEAAAVPSHQIAASALCTACRPDLFSSFRRDKTLGNNMTSGIVLK